ncbi:hypothetical protein M9458_013236, partial [Cirrhinus mrigala]
AELKALSACQLMRSPSEREGLTTFTVVPQRRQQSRQCFEMPLILQTPNAAKAEQELSHGDSDALEMPTKELLEAVPDEPLRKGSKGSDTSGHLSEVLHPQPVEQENQTWTDVESENLELEDEDYEYIQPRNTELENVESLQSSVRNLEHSRSMINNLELRDSWANPSKPADKLADRSPTDPKAGLVEQEEMEEHALVKTGEEKDWEEEYEERRRKFLDGENSSPTDPKADLVEQEEMEEHALVETGEENDWEEEYKERRWKFLDGENGSPTDPKGGLVEQEEMEEHALVETGEEKDWEEEYKERRKMFLDGENGSPTDPKAGLVEQEEMEEHALVETGEEKDWQEEYKERRRTFLGGENGSPTDPKAGLVEQEEMEEHALVETGEEKDWVEEYKERRRKFLGGENGSPTDPKASFVEQEEMEEHALVETGEEKDWEEEYKERRRKFLGGENGLKKLDVWGKIQREFTNVQEEKAMQEMDFPSPPPPVCWDVNNGENEDGQTREKDLDQWANLDSKPKYAPHSQYSKPKAHSSQTNGDPNTSSAGNNCSSTPEHHGTSFISKSHSTFDHCPPATVSLFALAVFQKAKRSKPGLDPNCSRRRELPVHTHSE